MPTTAAPITDQPTAEPTPEHTTAMPTTAAPITDQPTAQPTQEPTSKSCGSDCAIGIILVELSAVIYAAGICLQVVCFPQIYLSMSSFAQRYGLNLKALSNTPVTSEEQQEELEQRTLGGVCSYLEMSIYYSAVIKRLTNIVF
jgi:hypothetical protein